MISSFSLVNSYRTAGIALSAINHHQVVVFIHNQISVRENINELGVNKQASRSIFGHTPKEADVYQ
jgi:glucan biosynthesis protein